MPTASEYRHEPYGIPCHCYVRRRINRSLGRKSCLRKAKESQHCSSEPQPPKPPKTVTFDPVLRIRSYRSPFRCDDYHKPLPDAEEEEPIRSHEFNHRPADPTFARQHEPLSVGAAPAGQLSPVLSPKTNFNWALCDKITSFFGFQKVTTSTYDQVTSSGRRQKSCSNRGGGGGGGAVNLSKQLTDLERKVRNGHRQCSVDSSASTDNSKPLVDENNNSNNDDDDDEDFSQVLSESSTMDRGRREEHIYGNRGCPAGTACKYAIRPRERTPPRRGRPEERAGVSRIREAVVGAGRKSRSSSSSWEYGNFAGRKPTDSSSDSSSQYAPKGGSSASPYQVSGCDFGARGAALDCCSEGGCCPPAYEPHSTMPPMSTFQCPSVRDDSSAAGASMAAQPSQDGDDRTTEKSDEYIYESPDNRNNREYEYVPVKSSLRRRTESENLDSCLTVPAFEGGAGCGNVYGGGGGAFVKHKTESDLSVEAGSPEKAGGHHARVDVLMTPQSAPDLQAIMCSPYDIKFLNECVKAYVRSAGDSELEIDILAKIQTIEGTERAPLNRRLGGTSSACAGRKSPVVDDIFKMTPVALFWTGCAFLIALIYIILFSCGKDHEEEK